MAGMLLLWLMWALLGYYVTVALFKDFGEVQILKDGEHVAICDANEAVSVVRQRVGTIPEIQDSEGKRLVGSYRPIVKKQGEFIFVHYNNRKETYEVRKI